MHPTELSFSDSAPFPVSHSAAFPCPYQPDFFLYVTHEIHHLLVGALPGRWGIQPRPPGSWSG